MIDQIGTISTMLTMSSLTFNDLKESILALD